MAGPTPWWNTIRLREEIVSAKGGIEDVQMSLFNAVHGAKGKKPPYADAGYYAGITFPSPSLIELMAKIAVRLGAPAGFEAAHALWRLDQGMGGGKSHGLIGLYHLAANTDVFAATDVGERVFAAAEAIAGQGAVATDLNRPRVVVMSCDNMTPGKGDRTIDGPAETLGERFLWRLFDGAHRLWNEYRDDTGNKARLAEALNAVGRPVLILVDEIMDYIRSSSAVDDENLVTTDMAFLRALLDSVNDVPNCAMVVVMISSDKDRIVVNEIGQRCRDELDDLLVRNGRTDTVTTANDFAEIIRKRLFDAPPPAEVLAATASAWLDHMGGAWHGQVFDRFGWAATKEFRDKVARSYPFHPALIELAEQEWSLSTGFQRVRSTIQIFAAAVYVQQQRARKGEWVPHLIGPGDLVLSSGDVKEALLNSGLIPDNRTVSSYREIAGTEIVASDDQRGTARQLDLHRSGHLYSRANPRAAERAATALFVYSIGSPRAQGRNGAMEVELKAASFVPDASFAVGDAEVVLTELRDPEQGLAALEEIAGKGGQPSRYFLSTRQTLNMLVRAQRNAIGDSERDQALADVAFSLAKTGPFSDKVLVEAKGENEDPRSLRDILREAGIDDARKTRLVVLDPRRFSLLNGVDEETRDAVKAAMGLGSNKLAVGWASSAVFAVVNTQRRKNARAVATEYLARKRVAEMDAIRGDDDLADRAKEELTEAKRRLEKAVRDAYQHVVFLGEESDGTRVTRYHRFDKDGQSSLNGETVWAALSDADKAFARGEFDSRALLHNLRDNDLGRPLNEIRDAFWNTPRLALLPGGEEDLRSAIFGSLSKGDLLLVDKDGNERTATNPSEINLSSVGLRLARPYGKIPEGEQVIPDVVGLSASQAQSTLQAAGFATEGAWGGRVTSQAPSSGSTAAVGSAITVVCQLPKEAGELEDREYLVSVTLNTSLSDDDRRYAVRKLLSTLATVADQDASHVQLTVKVTAPEVSRDKILGDATDAGAQQATSTQV